MERNGRKRRRGSRTTRRRRTAPTGAIAVVPGAGALDTQLRATARRAADFAKKSRADSTLRVYRLQWEAFCSWCSVRNLSCLPAAPQAVLLYVTEREMGVAGGKPAGLSTILQIVAAVAHHHKTAEQPVPTHDPKLRQVLEGMVRTKSRENPPRRAFPLNPEQLGLLCAASGDSSSAVRDRALVLLGWAAARRRSEIVAWDLADVAQEPTGVVMTVRRSKTDQLGRGTSVGVLLQPDEAVCPVRALRRWLELRGEDPGPLFQSVRHGVVTGRRLDGKEVTRIIKKLAKRAGFSQDLIDKLTAHSLRSGFATTAAKRKKSPFAIAKQGGWSSLTTLQRYIRDAELLDDDNPTRGLL